MDLLAEVLAVSGVRATLGARIEAADSWGVRWAGTADAAFYAVTAGFAWLGIEGRAARQLMPGDVVLLPKGTGHTLSSQPNAAIHACDLAAAEKARGNGDVLRFGAGTVQTRIVGAAYGHDPAVSTQVLGLLPDVVHLRSENGGDCLDDTVRLLGRELAHPQMASAIVLNSLIDILLVQLLRTWLAANPDRPDQSWLGVLGDPLMTEALTKLHKQPDRAWTTETLAAQMSVSRSTLSRRFTAVLGQSPGAYLTQWRMDLAACQLRDTDASIAAVARSVGYTSQYAFSRAFTRARAQSPGRYRVTARSA